MAKIHLDNSSNNGSIPHLSENSSKMMTDDEFLQRNVIPHCTAGWAELAIVLSIFSLLLIVGLVGNLLVILAVACNRRMHTATNIFLVNLALADFFVLVCCLPPTLAWDLTKTWWFDTTTCKAMLYVQHVAVTASLFTMVAVALERWHAICHPLKHKSVRTATWSIRLLLAIWLVALVVSLPQPLVVKKYNYNFTSFGRPQLKTDWVATCDGRHWPWFDKVFWLVQTVLLFVLPLVLIAVLYGRIAQVLWLRSPAGSGAAPPAAQARTPMQQRSRSTALQHEQCSVRSAAGAGGNRSYSAMCQLHTGKIVKKAKKRDDIQYAHAQTCRTDNRHTASMMSKRRLSAVPGRHHSQPESVKTSLLCLTDETLQAKCLKSGLDKQTLNRRKAAKMLIAVVILFVVCYAPTFALNLCQSFNAVPPFLGNSQVFVMSIRFLMYFNSCVNPIIYNLMSEKFQQEFRNVCQCITSGGTRIKQFTVTMIDVTECNSSRQNDNPAKWSHSQSEGSLSRSTRSLYRCPSTVPTLKMISDEDGAISDGMINNCEGVRPMADEQV